MFNPDDHDMGTGFCMDCEKQLELNKGIETPDGDVCQVCLEKREQVEYDKALLTCHEQMSVIWRELQRTGGMFRDKERLGYGHQNACPCCSFVSKHPEGCGKCPSAELWGGMCHYGQSPFTHWRYAHPLGHGIDTPELKATRQRAAGTIADYSDSEIKRLKGE